MKSQSLNPKKELYFENILASDDKDVHKHPVRAIVYNKNLNQKIFIESNAAFYKHQVVKLTMHDKQRYAFIQEIQKHPVNQRLIHVDFFMPDESYNTIDVRLPVHFVGQEESTGLKRGGMLYITSRNIPVRMDSNAIVPYLEINISSMNNGDTMHISHLKAPQGIQFMRRDISIATLLATKS